MTPEQQAMPPEQQAILALLVYLRENAEFYRTNRKVYISPAERAKKVKFYEDSANVVAQLVDLWHRVAQLVDL